MPPRLASAVVLLLAWASASALTTTEQLARDILAELVAIDTFRSGDVGRTREAADLLAARLKRAGFPAGDVRVLGLTPGDGNLIARYRSARPTQRPVILLAHLDTVSTSPVNWDTNPVQLVEKDGYYYGRGTRDIKDGVARLVANFIRLKAEGFRPNRDLIILLTADEETSGANLVWLLDQHRPLLDAAFGLNTDAGYVELTPDGRPNSFVLQTAEKIYASFALEASSPGASDGLFLRGAGIPTYGIGAVPEDPDDDRSHAPNERIPIAGFNQSLEYWYRLTRRLAE